MRHHLKRIEIILVFIFVVSLIQAATVYSESSSDLISAKLVKDKLVLEVLIKEANEILTRY